MSTVIIIVILAVIIFFAVRSSKKHLTGEETCCSGSVPKVKRKKNKLEGAVVSEKEITVNGMHCENCREHVEEALEELDCVSAKVNLRQKTAVVRMTKEVADDTLRKLIEDAGYEVDGIKTLS